MFVPVSCTNCGKPFQVPEAALGKPTLCPWCAAVVAALPVAPVVAPPEELPPTPTPSVLTAPPEVPPPAPPVTAVVPAEQKPKLKPKPIPGIPVPLSLDDDPPEPRAPEPRAKPKYSSLVTILVGAIVVVVVTAATLTYRHYGSGRLSESGWTEFTAPDGSFSTSLPGRPTEEDVAANPAGSVTGGKRFSTHAWYSKSTVWVSYCDIEPALLPKLAADPDRVVAAGVLQAEREREKTRLGVTNTTEVMIRDNDAWGVKLHFDTPRGKAAVWMVLIAKGPHPRVYVFGVEGKGVDPKSPVVARPYSSFRLNN